jgi:hypothetical protein
MKIGKMNKETSLEAEVKRLQEQINDLKALLTRVYWMFLPSMGNTEESLELQADIEEVLGIG